MDHSYISVPAPLIPNRLETIKQKHIKKTSPLQRLDRVMDKALGVWTRQDRAWSQKLFFDGKCLKTGKRQNSLNMESL